jgi:GTP-binding protein HflX
MTEKIITCGVFSSTGGLNDSDEQSLSELKALCEACGAEVVGEIYQNRGDIDPRTVIGKGKVEEIRAAIARLVATLVVFDCELSGSNTRNLENDLECRVIDRSRLILDIFARRAVTKEGKCQVLLAQLSYTLPRLVGTGASLSRLGGGIGTRGPGETQLETDRRHIRERIANLRRELKEIEKNRETQRKQRLKSGIVNIALVGYTNSGKSSLLNSLTNAGQYAENMLFATLDPLSKKFTLPDGREAVITDTVGFIRKLPHHLVEAFKSTLEETVYADLILHVIDGSDENAPNIDIQTQTAEKLLRELKADEKPVLNVYNKSDLADGGLLLPPDKNGIFISAKTGHNIDKLLAKITELTKTTEIEAVITVPYDKTSIVARLYDDLKILNIEYKDDGQSMTVYGKEEFVKHYEKQLQNS